MPGKSRFISQSGAKTIALDRGMGDAPETYNPEDAVPNVHDKDDLRALLDWYSRSPVLSDLVPDNQLARRYYIERVRPALRWYCKHMNVDIPRFLYDEMLPEWTDEERLKHFGEEPLHVIEFERRGNVQPTDMKPTKLKRG